MNYTKRLISVNCKNIKENENTLDTRKSELIYMSSLMRGWVSNTKVKIQRKRPQECVQIPDSKC